MIRNSINFFWCLFCSPIKFGLVGGIVVLLSLSVDGTFLRLWSLEQDYKNIDVRIQSLKKEIQNIEKQMVAAQDPAFIERAARERFQLVHENDLLFLFTD